MERERRRFAAARAARACARSSKSSLGFRVSAIVNSALTGKNLAKKTKIDFFSRLVNQ